jgi:pimeloyl-ACP methyl ester carboxylesterase
VAAPAIAECIVRGTSVKVMRMGEGSPLLLLRGTDASDVWLPYMTRLAERHDVIVPEHPGFGGKPAPPWLDRVGDLANFHLDLIDHLGIADVHLVGTSLGGWIAADLAHRSSAKLASLTLVGAAGVRVPGAEGIDIFLIGEEPALRGRFHDPAKAEAAVVRMLAPETEDVRLANAITVARVAWDPRLHDPELAKWLHRIKVPTEIVWGEHDRVFPGAVAEAFRDGIPGARLTIVPGCGHAVQLEQPDALVSILLDFTATHGRRA